MEDFCAEPMRPREGNKARRSDYGRDKMFSYKTIKGGRLLVEWQGNTVRVLKGPRAWKLARELEMADPEGVQLTLAKATGNFKRGNERAGRGGRASSRRGRSRGQ